MNLYLLTAGVLSLITCGIHVFAGGPAIAKPLMVSEELPRVSKYTNYYCWHIVTLTLFAMSASFFYAALPSSNPDIAILMTLLSASFALWSIFLVLWKKQSFKMLPQWSLFVVITTVAVPGLF